MGINNNRKPKGGVGFSPLSFDFLLEKLILFSIIISILLFILFPIFSIIATSVYKNGVFSLQQYKNLLNEDNIQLIKNSILVSTLSSIFTVMIAFCIALYVFIKKGTMKKLISFSLMLTMISPPFVSALALIMLFGRRGLITNGIFGLSVNPYGCQGVILLQTIGQISFASILLINTLNSMDLRLILASRDLGATPLQTLKNVIIPASSSGIMSVLFILFTMNLADFGTPIIIGGKFKVLATEAYMTIISSANLGKASAISVLLIPPAMIAFYFYNKNMTKANNMSDGNKSFSNSSYEFDMPKYLNLFLATITLLFFVVMILKYGNIFLSTVSNTSSGKIRFTTKNFEDLKPGQINSFTRSILYGVTAAILASLIGITLSYFTRRRKIVYMKYFEFISSLPYIIPGTFFGLGYIVAFNNKPLLLTDTAIIIILNFTFRQISVSNKAANAAFTKIDLKIEDAARDLGASRIKILSNIIFPLLKPVFLTSFIMIFTTCMTTIGAVIFLISPGKTLISTEMFKAIQNGQYGLGSVLASFMILVTVSINLIAIRLLNKNGGK